MSIRTTLLARRASAGGYVMILSIIMLLMITFLTVSMAKSFFFEEGMAGNVREKNRSYAVAQAALNYAELVASQGGATVNSSCSGALSSATICSTGASLTSGSSSSPLSSYFTVPTSVLPAGYMNVNTSIAVDTYYAKPGAYIQYVGIEPGTAPASVYVISAYGYGSTPNSVSILQSYFEVVSMTPCTNSNQGC